MDARKRLPRFLIPILIIIIPLLFVGLWALFLYLGTQMIADPKSCFTTQMNHVEICPRNANYLKISQVPHLFIRALVLSEDASFYGHEGFDWFEIKESFRRNIIEWRFSRGGSTLTQQLAKNLYLKKDKTLSRKIKEFLIARELEEKLSKSEILEKYVNVVEFGPEIYGLKNAASHYFRKSPANLNLLEISYLVSLLPNPKSYGASLQDRKLSRINQRRMEIILSRLFRTRKINDEIYVYAKMLVEQGGWPFSTFEQNLLDTQEESSDLMQELQQELSSIPNPSPEAIEQATANEDSSAEDAGIEQDTLSPEIQNFKDFDKEESSAEAL